MYVLDEGGNPRKFADPQGNVKLLEYRYLEYDQDGYVVKIYTENPGLVTEGHKIAISTNQNFEPGSEYNNYIIVQKVDVDNNLTSSVMVRQPESVKFLRQERDRLASALIEAQNAINALLGV